MVPMWFAPIAIACGNTFILKPSEKTPLTSLKLAEYFDEAGIPEGVFNVVTGDKEAVEAQFEMMVALTECVVEFEKAYGTGKFKGSKPIITEEDLADLEIEGSGDTAVARTSSDDQDIKLIKKGGTWYVDMSDAVSTGAEAAQIKKAMGPMAEGIRKVTANIGKEGYDEQTIRTELGTAIMRAEMSAGGG